MSTPTLNFSKMSEGSTLNFSKDVSASIKDLVINLNWVTNLRDVDLDICLSAVSTTGEVSKPGLLKSLFGGGSKASTKVEDFIYFGNRKSPGVSHLGDDRTGSVLDGEFIVVDLTKIPRNIKYLVPSMISWDGTKLSDLSHLSFKVYLGTRSSVDTPIFEVDFTGVRSNVLGVSAGYFERTESNEWVWTTKIKHGSRSGSSGLDEMKSIAENIK